MAQNHSGIKLKSYTVAFKIEVVEWYRGEGMQNVTQTAKKFGVDRKRVREWNGKYDALLDVNVGEGKKKRKIHKGGSIFSQQVDCEVFAFLEQERSEGRAVLNNDLSQKAVQVAEHLGLQGFLASKMWLQRWKRRWNVGYRRGTNTSQKVPDDYKDQLTHFRRSIIRYRELHTYRKSDIANMDQTMCRYVHTLHTKYLTENIMPLGLIHLLRALIPSEASIPSELQQLEQRRRGSLLHCVPMLMEQNCLQ